MPHTIYNGMEYALPVTALSSVLLYEVQIINILTVAEDTNLMNISLTCRISRAEGEDNHLYNVSLEKLIINGREEGDYEQMEWLFAKVFSINSELIIKTDQHGAIKGIGDKTKILATWEIAKADINSIYEPADVAGLINSIETALHDDKKSLYYDDLLLNILFNNIYQTYTGQEQLATAKTLLKHFGNTALPIIEYKELIAIIDDPKTTVIEISGQVNADELDFEGMNHYLAEITEQESDIEMDYYFDYQGTYYIKTGTENYIDTAELTITGSCEGYKKQAIYKLKLLSHE